MEDKVVEEIEDETQHVISNMLDCEEVFGESIIVVVKAMLMAEYDGRQSSRPHWFLNLMPTHFFPRTSFLLTRFHVLPDWV